MLKVGIVGGTGYTGAELLRLLSAHPKVQLTAITSRGVTGPVGALFPHLNERVVLRFSEPRVETLSQCDLVFFATPNGTAMTMAPELLAANVKVIDLAADFRLREVAIWERWYQMQHAAPEVVAQAIYGLPELYKDTIRTAQIVANPGCYPTASCLGLLPLLQQPAVDLSRVIIDAKSGVSGAGRQPQQHLLLCEASENLNAYGVTGHRHQPEIEQTLAQVAGKKVNITFIPHLIPMMRGMLATIYVQTSLDGDTVTDLYRNYYADAPFVVILPKNQAPHTKNVRGTNFCHIAICEPHHKTGVVIFAAIDNLVKGAAGQAVHNMNLMWGFEETLGLNQLAVVP